jgi:MATE family multidrug resistance protein
VKCSPEVRRLATQYFYIRIWAAPATISLFAFKGWFIGMQDSVRAMAADLTVNIVNIAGSITLALLLGFKGIALGAVLAQWCGFAYCCIAVRRRFASVVAAWGMERSGMESPGHTSPAQKGPNDNFFKMNRDLVLRSISMIAVYIGFTVISARHGDLMLASASILMKLLMLFSYFSDGFAYAGEALTGRFVGEQSADGVHSAVRGSFLWGGGCALLFLGIYGLCGVPLLRLFSGDVAVVDAAREFLPWLMLMPLIGIPAFIWDGIYTGATRTRDMMISVVLCAIGFFATYLGGYYLLGPDDVTSIHILMAAYFVHLLIRSLWLTVRWRGSSLKIGSSPN